MATEGDLHRGVRLRSATALVVANMIGAGIFTTTGFQAADLGNPLLIFSLWAVGGVLALCGALCFAELGAAMPEAGAEYVYIREAFGPAASFTSAFVAVIAGFSAPIAGALKSAVAYSGSLVPFLSENRLIAGGAGTHDLVAIGLGWLLVVIHARGIRVGLGFNDIVTAFKVAGIVGIIIAAFALGKGDAAAITHVAAHYAELSWPQTFAAYATSLIFVSFCYLGWNASAYMAAEMPDPQRQLPRSLLAGTGIVTVLYLLLNVVYFYGASVEELAGKVDVGVVAAQNLFGTTGVTLVTVVLCVSIIASASAMTAVGPRVYYAFGKDFPPLRILARTDSKTGAPVPSLVLQGIATTIIILSGTVDQIFQYAGFTLTLFASLAVLCVLVLRVRRPELARPFRVWGYPWTPLLFLGVNLWTMGWALLGRPVESLLGLGTALAGGILFYVMRGRH